MEIFAKEPEKRQQYHRWEISPSLSNEWSLPRVVTSLHNPHTEQQQQHRRRQARTVQGHLNERKQARLRKLFSFSFFFYGGAKETKNVFPRRKSFSFIYLHRRLFLLDSHSASAPFTKISQCFRENHLLERSRLDDDGFEWICVLVRTGNLRQFRFFLLPRKLISFNEHFCSRNFVASRKYFLNFTRFLRYQMQVKFWHEKSPLKFQPLTSLFDFTILVSTILRSNGWERWSQRRLSNSIHEKLK